MKKTRLMVKVAQLLFYTLTGLGFIIHGVSISNMAEIFIGTLPILFAWSLFKDNEYGESVRECITNKK